MHVASRGSVTYEVAKFVTTLISPLVGRTPYHIKHSVDLKDKLTPIHIEEDETIVSFDVSALFTSVPIGDAVCIIGDMLRNDESLPDRTKLSVAQIVDLLTLCLPTTYFLYAGAF